MIRLVDISDAKQICDIYNYYIENTTISFEEEPVTIKDMRSRLSAYTEKLPWLVYEVDGKILGYAYATQFKSRRAYRYTAEVSVYIDDKSRELGIGRKLYEALIPMLFKLDIHSIIAVIALPNNESISLHEKLGFEKTAHFKEVGYKFDTWIDVAYWQYNGQK